MHGSFSIENEEEENGEHAKKIKDICKDKYLRKSFLQ